MQQILEAIQAGATGDDIANLPIPESYRAAFVKRDETDDVRGHGRRGTRTRASRSTSTRSPTPELAPDEVYIAVMAARASTSTRSGRRSSSRCRRSGSSTAWPARTSGASATRQPYHVVGSDASGVVLRVGSAVRNWKPGDRVTVHCNYVDDQDPTRPQRLDARQQPADLGLRDQLRRPRRPVGRQGQPADAEADAPVVGGSGRQRAVQLDVVSHARQRATAPR